MEAFFSELEHKQIEHWSQDNRRTHRIWLETGDAPFRAQFQNYADALQAVAGHLEIKRDGDAPSPLPAFRVAPNLRFRALPKQHELPPFLEAIAGSTTALSPQQHHLIENIRLPAALTLYVADACPNCPATVRQLIPVVRACEHIFLEIIDAGLFTEVAARDKVQAVPCLLMEDAFRWNAAVPINDLLEMVANRNPEKLSAASLKEVLQQGEAPRLASMMIENDTIFPAFLELLSHTKWPLRLGAMVTAEYICAQSPSLANRMGRMLWPYFAAASDTVRGDILHVIGESGNRALTDNIESVCLGDYDKEVLSAANEALEKLRIDSQGTGQPHRLPEGPTDG